MSLTARFDSLREHPGTASVLPVAAATIIYYGNMAATNAQGNAVPATDAPGLKVAGVALPATSIGNAGLGGFGGAGGQPMPIDADNTGGASGAISVPIRAGLFRVRNSATSPLGVADLGTMAVVQDPETVAKASTNNIPAGVVLILEAGFVWVWFPSYIYAVPASAWRSFGVGTFGQ